MAYSQPGRQLSASTVSPRQGSAGHGKQLKPSGGGLSTGLRQPLHSFSTLPCIPDTQGEERRRPGAPRSLPGSRAPGGTGAALAQAEGKASPAGKAARGGKRD